MADRWEQYGFRSLDDLIHLVTWAAKLRPVKEIRIAAGAVAMRRTLVSEADPFDDSDKEPKLVPPEPMPSDTIVDKLGLPSMEWGLCRSKSMVSAYFKAIAFVQQKSMYATHIITGDAERLFGSLPKGTSLRDPENGKWGWFGGLEVVNEPALGEGVHLICGGHRVHGGIPDIQIAVRMEAGE